MNTIEINWLGVKDYNETWELQKSHFNAMKIAKQAGTEVPAMQLLLVEHPHVYTLGRNGNPQNILFSPQLLEQLGATFYQIERGGDITYHGYGQLVGYPILDLEQLGIGVKQYVWLLEEAVIRTIATFGIQGRRYEGMTGVWIGEEHNARKICAIGVKISRFITMHGFALNVTTNLDYFRYINPCGFVDKTVTSIAQESGATPTVEAVSQRFVHEFFALLSEVTE